MGWPLDPNDKRIQAALAWTCDICKAGIGELCSNTIQPDHPLPGRLVHIARLHDRRRK